MKLTRAEVKTGRRAVNNRIHVLFCDVTTCNLHFHLADYSFNRVCCKRQQHVNISGKYEFDSLTISF